MIQFRVEKLLERGVLAFVPGDPSLVDKKITISELLALDLVNVLTAWPNFSLEKAIAGNKQTLLFLLSDRPMTKNELHTFTGLSFPTLHRILYFFKSKAIVSYKKKRYHSRTESSQLFGMVRNLHAYLRFRQLLSVFVTLRAVIPLPRGLSLVASLDPEPPDGFFRTAMDRFGDLGVNVLGTDTRFYCDFEPTREQIIAHAILLATTFHSESESRTHDAFVQVLRANREHLDLEGIRQELRPFENARLEFEKALGESYG